MVTEAAAMAQESGNANEIIHYFGQEWAARCLYSYADHVYDMDHHGDRFSFVLRGVQKS